MLIKKLFLIFFVLSIVVIEPTILSPIVYADCTQSTSSNGANWNDPGTLAQDPACLSDPRQAMSLTGPLISWAIGLLIIAAAIGAIGMFVFGAYKYMMSEGDPSKTAEARKTIQYAVAGLLITAAVYLFIIFYNNIFPKAG